MQLKPTLALLFLIKANCLLAQQIDIMPYIGLNNNITNLVLKMHSTSLAEPVTYNTMGAGLVASSAWFNGGFYTSIILKNQFGLQSGARFSQTDHFFYLTETKNFEFGNSLIYYINSDQLAMPLHLVYDYKRSAADSGKNKAPNSIRFFAGPVFSYNFNSETRLLENHAVSSATGTMIASYSDVVTKPTWLPGIEFGLNVNPVFKDLISIGLLFQYNPTPVAKVNFESKTIYESATAKVDINNTGTFTVIGSSLMFQIGVKPFILKKEKHL